MCSVMSSCSKQPYSLTGMQLAQRFVVNELQHREISCSEVKAWLSALQLQSKKTHIVCALWASSAAGHSALQQADVCTAHAVRQAQDPGQHSERLGGQSVGGPGRGAVAPRAQPVALRPHYARCACRLPRWLPPAHRCAHSCRGCHHAHPQALLVSLCLSSAHPRLSVPTQACCTSMPSCSSAALC